MKYVTQPLTLEGKLLAVADAYRDHFATFMLIAAVVWVPAALVEALFFGASASQMQAHTGIAVGLLLVPLVPLAVAFFIQGAAVDVAIAQACLDQRPTVASSYAGAFRKAGNLFVVSLLYGLIVGVGLVLFVVPGLVFLFRYAYAPGIVIVEDASPMDALRRSAQLSSGRKGSLFVTLLVVGIVTGVITKAVGFFLGGIPLVGAFATVLPQILFAPLTPLVMMLDYLNAREADTAPVVA